MDDALLDDIRSRINPQYQDIKGTESYERKQMVDEIDRLKAEMEEAHTELAISIKERIDLGNHLAEARAETTEMCERVLEYKSELFAAQLKTLKARQDAAREIIEYLKSTAEYSNQTTRQIKNMFGLEG